jgi:hypothetical protein
MVLHDHFDRMAFDAALQVEKVGVIASGLSDLWGDESVDLGEVVSERETHRIGRGRRHDIERGPCKTGHNR